MSGNGDRPGGHDKTAHDKAAHDQAADDKARRLAEALRRNLRRRKAQARARAGGAADAGVATRDQAVDEDKG